jgi:hypothetical protein
MQGTHSDETQQIVQETGFELAFLSHSDLIQQKANPFQLPRISLPDQPMSQLEFCARVAGAGIILRRLKRVFGAH